MAPVTTPTCTDAVARVPAAASGLTILVGGVGELYQGDLDMGRLVIERLRELALPRGTVLEDLHYGAIAVTQLLEEVAPDVLVLVGAKRRHREPTSIHRRVVADLDLDPADVQTSVSDAGTGYVDLDLVVDVAWGLGALPERTVVVEVEPAETGPGEGLSTQLEQALPVVTERVRDEVERAGLFDLAERLRPRLERGVLEPSPMTEALGELVAGLDQLAEHGTWGGTLAARDRVRLAISEGRTSPGMDHGDWAMVWALVEEVERLARLEVERDRRGTVAGDDPASGLGV